MTGTSDQTGEEDRALVPSVFDRLDRLERRLESADAERLLLCLDFDGTLAPHVDDPALAELTAENRRVLEALDRHPAVDIAVISGRALNDVRDRVGIDGFDYAGNHGLEFEESMEGGALATERYRSAIQSVCADLQARFEGTDCEVENKTITATVHYRNASVTEDRVRSVIKESIDNTDEELQMLSGTNIVEIRPAIDWDKGCAVQQFEERDEYLPVYVGDDTTDEDAFRAIPEGISVHVGSDRDTAAKYRVSGVDDVTSFLDWIAETGIDAITTDTKKT